MLKSITTPLASIVVIMLVTGFAFELGYQLRLGANVFALSLYHYVLSGFIHAAPPFVFLAALALLIKFLSPRLKQDDWKEISWNLGRTTFDNQVGIARAGFVIAIAFFVIVLLDVELSFGAPIGSLYWFMLFVVVKSFAGSVMLSPNHSKATILFACGVALALCSAAGGIWSAKLTAENPPHVRDDAVTREEQIDGKWVVTPKDIPFISDFKSFLIKG